MRGWWREFSGLVLPAACGGCGEERTALCERCRAALLGAPARRVRPAPEPAGLPVVYASAGYEDAVRAMLLGHKERGALGLAGVLGQALAAAVRAAAGHPWPGDQRPGGWLPRVRGFGAQDPGTRGLRPRDPGVRDPRAGVVRVQNPRVLGSRGSLVLVPVPSSRRAVRARGHDATRRVAFAAAAELRRTGTDARVASVLRQRRAVADQAGLSAPQRLANLSGALTVAGGGARLLTGGQVVLVDDLMTTGASLVEAARVVRGAGSGSGIREPRTGLPDGDGCLRQGIPGFSLPGPAHHRRRTGEAQSDAGQPPLVAAVVAVTPESFAINRN
ncbi:ComF family protein [Streptomyces sp. NBC_00083]|uniref:ComF family protein n=1 Tax=Streptomyces sp. NBC_00083 TaxID=2975647 RepID=UPI0022528A7B|nr:ComF family protein [Streptomyces sp. NBC_00083]MCX5382111.1 ComF family protein [Streptomyces sp. NBC_00083]